MNISFCIDWLGFTTPLHYMATPEQYAAFPTGHSAFMPAKAHNGYKSAWMNNLGATVQWNEERPEMRVLSQYSGATLNRYRDCDMQAATVLEIHSYKPETRLTRIDLAFDLRDTGFGIQAKYMNLKHGEVKCSTSKADLIVGTTGGTTLYIGSRQSDKFLRIYDKAAEQQIPGDWVRVELEIKGDTARELGKIILLNSSEAQLAKIAKSMLWSMVQFPDEIWQHLCADSSPVTFTISHKKSDNLKSWLADQVAPAIADYLLRGGDKDILDQLDILIQAQLRRKSRL
jgi:DNA relaxase NicK